MGLLIFGTGGGGGTGTDLSADTVTPQQVRNPYTFHDAGGNAQTGEIYNWDGTLLSGGSSDVNKMTVEASTNTRHLKAGCYLARDIELSAMPAGDVRMERVNNVVTTTKMAGYISGGTLTETIPTYSGETVTPGPSARTIALTGKYCTGDLVVATDSNLRSEFIRSGVSIFGVAGSYTGQSYPSYTGSTSVTPSASNQTLYTGGTVVGSNIVVYGDSNLKSENIRSGCNIFGINGSHKGLVVSSTSATPSGGSITINCGSNSYPMMISFVIGSDVETANTCVAGMGFRGNTNTSSTTGRGWVLLSGGSSAPGNILSCAWSSNNVTITPTGSYSFASVSYTIYVAYQG